MLLTEDDDVSEDRIYESMFVLGGVLSTDASRIV